MRDANCIDCGQLFQSWNSDNVRCADCQKKHARKCVDERRKINRAAISKYEKDRRNFFPVFYDVRNGQEVIFTVLHDPAGEDGGFRRGARITLLELREGLKLCNFTQGTRLQDDHEYSIYEIGEVVQATRFCKWQQIKKL